MKYDYDDDDVAQIGIFFAMLYRNSIHIIARQSILSMTLKNHDLVVVLYRIRDLAKVQSWCR